MKYECNGCADTQNINAPCKLELPNFMSKSTDALYCPLTGDRIDWDKTKE
jgi:hypothetical protein